MPWNLADTSPASAAAPVEQADPTPSRQPVAAYLRPPGACAEAELAGRCQRCGRCREACPHHAIVALGPLAAELEGSPAIVPEAAPCRLCDDLPCAAACPTGTLTRVPATAIRMGVATIAEDRCWAHRGQPCDYCVTACPLEQPAVVLRDDRPVVDPAACVGCGLCVYYCAGTPRAVRIEANVHGSEREETSKST